ncbi:MAG: diacylglycerol/lipid kinase family protein [Candidatus Coproplasma sp.]
MYHIIVNARNLKAKDAKSIQTVKSVFERAGKKYKMYFTEYAGHAKELAAGITKDGKAHTVIAMGGDGTLHEVLNGVKYPDKCRLGLIPFGSGNDFAACVDIPCNNVKHAAEIIAFKAPSCIDYIQTSTNLRSINSFGFGIDVDVLERAYAGKIQGRTKYFRALIKSLIKYKSRKFTIEVDGERSEHFGLIVCLGNGKQFGGGIKLFPQAKIDDGYMDLVVVDYLSRMQTLIAFIYLALGKLDKIKQLTTIKCKSAAICPEEAQYTVQAEGELYRYENVERVDAHLVSGELKFYLPKND